MKMIRLTGYLMAIFALLAAMTVFAVENKPKNNGNTPTISMTGFATYYTVKSCQSEGTSGIQTASGEKFDELAMTCAMRRRDWGSQFKVTNLELGKDYGKPCIVRLNDYGPGHGPTRNGVVIDLTPGVWKALGVADGRGKINVKVESYSPNASPPTALSIADTPPIAASPTKRSNKGKQSPRPASGPDDSIPLDPF